MSFSFQKTPFIACRVAILKALIFSNSNELNIISQMNTIMRFQYFSLIVYRPGVQLANKRLLCTPLYHPGYMLLGPVTL